MFFCTDPQLFEHITHFVRFAGDKSRSSSTSDCITGSSLSLSVLVEPTPPPLSNIHSLLLSSSHRFLASCRNLASPSTTLCPRFQASPVSALAFSNFCLNSSVFFFFCASFPRRSAAGTQAPLACRAGEGSPERALTGGCIAALLYRPPSCPRDVARRRVAACAFVGTWRPGPRVLRFPFEC